MSHQKRLFDGETPDLFDPRSGHVFLAGSSGTGKTQLLCAFARELMQNCAWGLHVICPEGDISNFLLETACNPANQLTQRRVHILKPASPTHAFAIPLLHVPDRTPLACHKASVRTLSCFEQFLSFGSGEYGPRLSKLFQMGAFGLALLGAPLIALPELYARGAGYLRALIGDAIPYSFIADELNALDALNERTFIEYRDSLFSRLMPIFGNEQLRRVFGPQTPVDVASILKRREIVLLDLSGLEHRDAVLVGTSYISVFFHQALERPANASANTCFIIDEAFDFLTEDLARGFDRLRKRNVRLVIAVQRLGQLQ